MHPLLSAALIGGAIYLSVGLTFVSAIGWSQLPYLMKDQVPLLPRGWEGARFLLAILFAWPFFLFWMFQTKKSRQPIRS